MKILFITPVIPTETDGRRPFNFLKYLSKQHEVDLLSLQLPVQKEENKKKLEAMGIHVRIFPINPWIAALQCVAGLFSQRPLRVSWCCNKDIREAIRKTCLSNHYDIVHIDRVRMGQYADVIRQPILLDFTDSMMLYFQRSIPNRRKWKERLIDLWESAVIPRYESKILKKIHSGIFCSPIDAGVFKEYHPGAEQIEIIENAVDPDQFQIKDHGTCHKPRCIMTGTLFYFPNVDSVFFYAKDILPSLRKSFPEMETQVIGTRPIKEINKLNNLDGLQIIPDVPKMEDYLFRDDIYVCPLRVAAGVRNKLLEAMASGMPIVTTRLGAEGLDVQEGKELLFAENSGEFIEQINRIMNNQDLRFSLGLNARRYIEEHNSLEHLGRKLETLYNRVICDE